MQAKKFCYKPAWGGEVQVRKAMLCYLMFLLRTIDGDQATKELYCTVDKLALMRREANEFINKYALSANMQHRNFAEFCHERLDRVKNKKENILNPIVLILRNMNQEECESIALLPLQKNLFFSQKIDKRTVTQVIQDALCVDMNQIDRWIAEGSKTYLEPISSAIATSASPLDTVNHLETSGNLSCEIKQEVAASQIKTVAEYERALRQAAFDGDWMVFASQEKEFS